MQENLKSKIDVYNDDKLVGQKDETDYMTNRVASQSDIQERLRNMFVQKMQTVENARKQIETAKNDLLGKRDLNPMMRRKQMADIETQEQMINDEISLIRSQAIRQGGQDLLRKIMMSIKK